MAPNDSIEQHLAKVQIMAANLIELGETTSNNIVISKLLSSFPPKYAADCMGQHRTESTNSPICRQD